MKLHKFGVSVELISCQNQGSMKFIKFNLVDIQTRLPFVSVQSLIVKLGWVVINYLSVFHINWSGLVSKTTPLAINKAWKMDDLNKVILHNVNRWNMQLDGPVFQTRLYESITFPCDWGNTRVVELCINGMFENSSQFTVMEKIGR